jgi:hypothetical protein
MIKREIQDRIEMSGMKLRKAKKYISMIAGSEMQL